jgi:hypothetical protein
MNTVSNAYFGMQKTLLPYLVKDIGRIQSVSHAYLEIQNSLLSYLHRSGYIMYCTYCSMLSVSNAYLEIQETLSSYLV